MAKAPIALVPGAESGVVVKGQRIVDGRLSPELPGHALVSSLAGKTMTLAKLRRVDPMAARDVEQLLGAHGIPPMKARTRLEFV